MDDRTTVVIVNWESLEYLVVALHALKRFSPPDLRIIVVDNASTDGSRAYLRARRDLRAVLLPANTHHGAALDVGFLLARTQYVVSMDVDAFPIRDDWLDQILRPLREGARVSGVAAPRGFVHPCALGIERQRFVWRRHTFVANYQEEGLGESAWDTGELISIREAPCVNAIAPSAHIGPYWVGTTWGGFLYHNFYAVRHRRSFGLDPGSRRVDDITAAEALRAWETATRAHLDLGPAERQELLRTAQG